MSERDWKALFAVISDPDEDSPTGMAETNFRGSGIVAILLKEQIQACPFWNELNKSGRLETVIGLDELADAAAGISINHPGNLAAIFPKQHELDRYLFAGSILGVSFFAMLCATTLNEARAFQKAQIDSKRLWTDQVVRLQNLKQNEREMLVLRSQMPDEPKVTVKNLQTEILGLAASIPESLLLRSVVIVNDGSVEIEALVINSNFDADRTRAALSDYGFIPDTAKGWIYDAVGCKLKIRGTYSNRRL